MKRILCSFGSGILLGILFAPAKGSDTRKKLSGRVNKMTDKVFDTLDDAEERMHSTIDKAKWQAEDLKNRVLHEPNNE